MALAHISAGKIVYFAANFAILAFVAIEPSVQVALVGLAGIVIVQLFALLLFYLKLRYIGIKVDGINSIQRADNKEQGIELTAASKRADHAEGVQQERTEARERHKDDVK